VRNISEFLKHTKEAARYMQYRLPESADDTSLTMLSIDRADFCREVVEQYGRSRPRITIIPNRLARYEDMHLSCIVLKEIHDIWFTRLQRAGEFQVLVNPLYSQYLIQ